MHNGNHEYMIKNFSSLGYSLRSVLNEADEDPNTTDTTEETPDEGDPNTDEQDSGEENTDTEEDTGDSTEESPDDSEDNESEEDTGEDNADEDFNIDAEDDTEDGETDTDGDDSSSDDINSDSGDSEEDEIDPDSLKALDGKLYEDLNPAEQKLKLRHMKQLYTDLFYKCASISEKLNSIFVEDDIATLQIKMAGSMIFNLKQMVSDYFLNIFDSKSYQENDIMFNRYLAILNQVKLLTDELKKLYFDDSE